MIFKNFKTGVVAMARHSISCRGALAQRLCLANILCLSLLIQSEALAKVNVVATVPTLAALAKEVGVNYVNVTSLSAATQDAHYVDPRPNLVLELNRADLLLLVGLDLEVGWLPALQKGARNSKVLRGAQGYLEAASVITPMQVPRVRIDRGMGDIHPGGNPHFLSDPRRAAKVALAIAQRLAIIDPKNRKAYQEAGKATQAKLLALAEKLQTPFVKLLPEKRQVVVYHQSFVYLLDWLHLQRVATVEPKPGIPPNPNHVAQVLSKMKERGVSVILQEEYYPQSVSKTLSKLADARLVILPGYVRFEEGEDYATHMTRIAQQVYDALKAKDVK